MAILSVKDLEAELRTSIGPEHRVSAQSACKRASDAVLGHLGTTESALVALAAASDEDAVKVERVKGIAMGFAIDVFDNPRDKSSYNGPEGLGWSGTPRARRTLFKSERDELDSLWVGGFA